MERLYVIVCADLSPGAQACQGIHAAVQFCFDHPEINKQWYVDSNYLSLLAVKNEKELELYIERACIKGFKFSVFQEPDFGNRATAAAFEPKAENLFHKLPKALSEIRKIEM
jgi:hypothetical protein